MNRQWRCSLFGHRKGARFVVVADDATPGLDVIRCWWACERCGVRLSSSGEVLKNPHPIGHLGDA